MRDGRSRKGASARDPIDPRRAPSVGSVPDGLVRASGTAKVAVRATLTVSPAAAEHPAVAGEAGKDGPVGYGPGRVPQLRSASGANPAQGPAERPVEVRAADAPPAASTDPHDVGGARRAAPGRPARRSEAPVTVNGKRLLTEEQLLKMPESDYMNDEQLAFFRHRLQQMESEILSNADSTTEHLRETVIVPDPADRATIEEEHALELRTRDRERKLLKKVQSSIASIDAGDYGYCEETGEPIGLPRLLARPTATLSLEAQQRREMKQKMYGD
jgi:DnaK suppressor protein